MGNRLAVWFMFTLGVILTVVITNDRSGTTIFLITTVIEAWVFVVVYGIWSKWRQADAARALFWVMLSYAILSTHITLSAVFGWRATWGYDSDIRQLLYLSFSCALFNLLLVVRRMQWETLEGVRRVIRESYENDPGGTTAYHLGHKDGVREERERGN